MTLEAWALAILLAKAPLSIADLPAYPGWEETQAERLERYQGIAHAAVEVGRTRTTVAKLLAVSFHESGWARDVDLGPCYRGKDGKSPRCDGGRASCMMQVRTDVHRWKSEDLFASREACFRAGLELLNRSGKACAKLGPLYAYDSYTGGACIDGVSLGHSRGLELFSLVERFRTWEPLASPTPSAKVGS